MTAAIIDETLGGLNYVLKREGIIPHGPSFTVHLEVITANPLRLNINALLKGSIHAFAHTIHTWLSCQSQVLEEHDALQLVFFGAVFWRLPYVIAYASWCR